MNMDKATPKSKRPSDFSLKNARNLLGQISEWQPKVFIKTFGCQMNVRDSEVICGLLKNAGFEIVQEEGKADVVIFNTCSVRQHAEDKVWSEVGRIAKLRKAHGPQSIAHNPRSMSHGLSTMGRKLIIGLVGCMAQNYKEAAFDRSEFVDFVVGPSDIDKIPGIIQKLSAVDHGPSTPAFFQRKIWETNGTTRPEDVYHTGFYEEKEHSFVVISEGCSNYCSYCVVPFVRGEIHHRPHKEIMDEIKQALDKGITSITLLGQNVNAYRSQDTCLSGRQASHETQVDFVKLLNLINQINGLSEFSFITSHPKDTSLELFKAMADLKKLKKSLHLPFQAGSDRILKLMNRGYTRKFYLDLADNYRKIVKDGVLTTDIIVGFPTETREEFQDTYGLVKGVEFNAAYIFKYSPRPHTEAAHMVDDVDKQEKERRHKLVLELQKNISQKLKAKSQK
jgi:tRNA-2-methylthio-N6-dimethylallyladenosine synthase